MPIHAGVAAAMVAIGLAWCGAAQAGDGPSGPDPNVDFAGQWRIIAPGQVRYSLTLAPTADDPGNLTGTFIDKNGTEGRVSAGLVIGRELSGYRISEEASGNLSLKMSADGNSFTGTWQGFRLPAGVALEPTPGVPTAQGVQYNYPYVAGPSSGEFVFLDWCREWATNCGEPAAEAFCAQVDGGRQPHALAWSEFKRAVRFNPSMTIGSRKICNDPNCSAFEHVVCGGGPSTPPAPSTMSGSCGPPGGTAVVTIGDPSLTRLNVRASPGGKVLGTIPEGESVSIVGECGSTPAAGIAATLGKPSGGLGKSPGQVPIPGPSAPPSTGGTPGWCQIDAPVNGCVSAKFLAFVPTGGAAGIAKPQTLGKPSSTVAAGFAGSWDAEADGVAYQVTLTQKGSTVSGRYSGADGSAGTLAGQLKGGVLRFSWTQNDGQHGSGKFTLAGDGQSFTGSYSLGKNPDIVGGLWNGTRR